MKIFLIPQYKMRWFLLFGPFLLAAGQTNDAAQRALANSWLNTNVFHINIANTPSLACTTDDNKDGQCVKPTLCNKDPTTNFEFRLSGCENLLQCCPLDQVLPEPKKTKTLDGLEECGWTNPGGYNIRNRMLGSERVGSAEFGEFPWMVALLKKSHTNVAWTKADYIGGGTIIHPSVVLTVAHKVFNKPASELKCRAGEYDTETENEIQIHQDRDVRKIAVHDQFEYAHARYDAALLFLSTPFELKGVNHVGVACLARDMPAPGTLCYSMGWGRSFDNPNYVTLLKKVQLPLVDPSTCESQLRRTKLSSLFTLHTSLTCAGGEQGVDTCTGDAGSSLVCLLQSGDQTRYLVHGMVAYGVGGCGQKDVPGVYAKVPAMLDWIKRKMDEEKLTTTTYLNY